MVNILNWFVPNEKKFFDLLKRQSKHLFYSVSDFKSFIIVFDTLSDEAKKEFLKKIHQHENHGDEITHHIIEALNMSFITPIDREDIHSLTVLLDDILDYVHTISKSLVTYKIKSVDKPIKKFVDIVFNQVAEIDKIVFSLNKFEKVKPYLIKINHFENEADNLLIQSLEDLFENEKDVKNIIKFKEIYNLLESTTDKGEHISNIINNIVIKHA